MRAFVFDVVPLPTFMETEDSVHLTSLGQLIHITCQLNDGSRNPRTPRTPGLSYAINSLLGGANGHCSRNGCLVRLGLKG